VVFTKTNVAKMHCPAGKYEALYWDASCRGLGLRALASGRRSWIYQYRDVGGQTRRMRLGDLTAVSLDAAREAVRQHAAKAVLGADPAAERNEKRQGARVIDVIDAYLEHAAGRQKLRSHRETQRYLRKHAKTLHHERIDSVGKDAIGALLDKAATKHGHVAANRMRAHLSAMWT
jgi:hypothetical protein